MGLPTCGAMALALVACSDDPPYCPERHEGSFQVDGHGETRVDEPAVVAASTRDELPCVAEAPIRAAVRTDDGEAQLASGAHRVVTIDGEPYVAVVRARRIEFVHGCNVKDTVEGPVASGYLVRTTPIDLPLAGECE